MKIYNSLTIDIETGQVLEEDSYEHTGQVAECKGGGGSQSKQTFLFPGMKPMLQRGAEWGIMAPLFGANFQLPQQGMGNAGQTVTTPNYSSIFQALEGPMSQGVDTGGKKKKK